MAMTSCGAVCSDAVQAMKHALNGSGSKAAHTRAKVFLQGMPDANGKYLRKKSSFSTPNITKSRQLSAPQIEPHKITKRISLSGYNFVRSMRGSVNFPKCSWNFSTACSGISGLFKKNKITIALSSLCHHHFDGTALS